MGSNIKWNFTKFLVDNLSREETVNLYRILYKILANIEKDKD